MEELLEILSRIKPGVNFSSASNLIDEGVLDSMDIVRLVGELNNEFDIEISVVDLIPENFNSIDAMMKMIKRLEDE